MRFAKQHISLLIGALFLFGFLLNGYPVFGFIMSSQNYRVQADSVNVGGIREGSQNYRTEDSIGEIATDESQSANYKIKAGYLPMLQTYLAISSPSDVSMSSSIPGIGGGTATGSAIWTVTTDDLAGYTLSVQASTSPALACSDGAGGCADGTDSFSDYTPSGASTPDFSFSVAVSDGEFGFTPEGSDLIQKFLDNGSNACNTGSNDTANACWYNFASAGGNIASSSSSNHPSGTSTTIKLQAESGASNIQPSGTYSAVITVTAVAN